MFDVDSTFLVPALVSLVVFAVALVYRWLTSKHDFFLNQAINGPTPSIPTGTWQNAWKLQAGEEDLRRIQRYGKVYGTFDGPTPNLVICEPQLIKQVLQNDSEKYRSRRAFKVKNIILHKSLMSMEGSNDKNIQQLANSALSSENIKKLIPRINKSMEALVQQITTESTNNINVNVSKCVVDYLSDALAFTMFGLDLNTDEKLKTQFTTTVRQGFTVSNPHTIFALSPFLFDSLGSIDDFILRKDCLLFLTSLCYSVLKKRRDDGVAIEGKAVDFLDLLLSAAEEEKKQAAKDKGANSENVNLILSDLEIVAQCVSVVLTVIQGSRSTLALAIYTLGTHPAVQDKLRAEFDKLLIKQDSSLYDLVQNASYLDMFTAEIFRLYPLEYRLERECVVPVTLGGCKLEPGTVVSVPIYAIHHLPENYTDPDVFDPERFSPENSSKRDQSIYLPFGQAGSNATNIGTQISVLLTKLALVVLVSSFHMTAVDGSKVPATFQKGFTGIPQPEELSVKVSTK